MRLRSIAVGAVPPLVVVGLWLGAVVIPTGNTSGRLQERLDASDAELADLAAVLEESRTANEQLVLMNTQLDLLSVAVPATPDVAGFVRLVDALATASDTVVASVTPQTEQPSATSSGVQVTSVSMALQGTYPAVMSFIERLLAADRLVEVKSVDLTADSSAGSIFVDLTVSLFSEPAAADAASSLVAAADQQITDAAAGLTLEAES